MNESTRFAGKKYRNIPAILHFFREKKLIRSHYLRLNAENCKKDRPLEKTGYENTLQLPQAFAKFAA
jgi:hypothetical protein